MAALFVHELRELLDTLPDEAKVVVLLPTIQGEHSTQWTAVEFDVSAHHAPGPQHLSIEVFDDEKRRTRERLADALRAHDAKRFFPDERWDDLTNSSKDLYLGLADAALGFLTVTGASEGADHGD